MVLIRHELRQGRTVLIVWSAAIAALLAVCILIYPEMAEEMKKVGTVFGNLGGLSAAFGMDRIDYGTLDGYIAVECGNVLGLGGALFAAMIGISALSKEEGEHTAEFLLTHPVSRARIVAEKLCAVLIQLIVLNAAVAAFSFLSVLAIGEEPDWKSIGLLFLAYFILQVETAAVSFGLSAFLRRGGMGVGLGLAAGAYFLNIIANLTEKAGFLKYITPFGYAEGADILTDGAINGKYLAIGLLLTAAGLCAAFWRYLRKDIAS